MPTVSLDTFDAARHPRRRSLQLLLLANGFPPAIGGVERYNWELCAHLAARGHRVSVLLLQSGARPDLANAPFTLAPAQPSEGSDPSAAVARAHSALQPDAVLVSRFSRGLAKSMAVLRRRRVPTLLFAHGLRRRDSEGGRAKRWRRRRAYGFDRAEAVFANSDHTRKRLLRFGVPDARVAIAYPGIDAAMRRSEGQRFALRSRFGLESKTILLTLARLEAEKRVDEVLRVLPWILARVPDVHYLIVGDGSERKRLERLADPVARHVTFVGEQSNVAAWYSASDVYVQLPRSETDGGYAGESFGMACAEASACGLPVVATSVGGIPEVVRHGTTGILVDPTNDRQVVSALALLLENRAQRAELGDAGRRYVAGRFTWEACARVVDQRLQRGDISGPHASGDGSSNQEDSR